GRRGGLGREDGPYGRWRRPRRPRLGQIEEVRLSPRRGSGRASQPPHAVHGGWGETGASFGHRRPRKVAPVGRLADDHHPPAGASGRRAAARRRAAAARRDARAAGFSTRAAITSAATATTKITTARGARRRRGSKQARPADHRTVSRESDRDSVRQDEPPRSPRRRLVTASCSAVVATV
ncbi:hypothetical protein M885DRAFT_622982, partial [Pelagophyceae sp. CCMP2097]